MYFRSKCERQNKTSGRQWRRISYNLRVCKVFLNEKKRSNYRRRETQWHGNEELLFIKQAQEDRAELREPEPTYARAKSLVTTGNVGAPLSQGTRVSSCSSSVPPSRSYAPLPDTRE